MIVKLILDGVKAVLLFIIGLFPQLPDMSSLSQSLDAVFGVVGTINSFVSVKLFCSCVVIYFVFAHIDFLWAIVMWAVKKLPGVD